MNATCNHNGKEIMHGDYTRSGEYRATRVNGLWYFHPSDSEWLAYDANDSFSCEYSSELAALEAASEWESSENE